MNEAEVIALLEENRDERGIRNWNADFADKSELQSFGIGLTRLRKMAKKIGRDRKLAASLWNSRYVDAKIVSLLVDDPKTLTRERAEQQVEQLEGGFLAHVFSSCDATLAKTSFVQELADEWVRSDDPVRRRCGYGLLYELSKSKKKSAPTDADFLGWIELMDSTHAQEDTDLKMAIAGALLGIGKRNHELNAAALRVARAIGPIDFDTKGTCDPFDVVKHLVSPALKKKLGL